MEFKREKRTNIKTIELKDYFDGICPFCGSKNLVTRSSRIRKIQDLGTTIEKVIVHLNVVTLNCKDCFAKFSPEHLDYPVNYKYSLNVLEYVLTRYNYHNISGNAIARDLRVLNNVEIPEATIYTWLRKHSPEFIKKNLKNDPKNLPSDIKSITIDGTYVNIGKDIIGKKKDVQSLSVTKLKDGRYLLMWWE